MLYYKNILYFVLAGLSIFMTSCYSDYVHLRYETYHGAQWNSDHDMIAFVASVSAYQKAKGISSFPDGGTPNYLFRDAGLFLLDTASKQLTKLADFNDLAELMKNRWTADIIYTDTAIMYKLKPNSEWDLYLKWVNSKEDSLKILHLKDKYVSLYQYNLMAEQNMICNGIDIETIKQDYLNKNKANLTKLNGFLDKVPVANWGIELKSLYPKSEDKYIKDLIYVAKDGSPLTKRAIIEQIVSKRSKTEKQDILNAMDKHKNGLDGLERTEYELYSKATYEQIKELL